jgi:hypothetical protein
MSRNQPNYHIHCSGVPLEFAQLKPLQAHAADAPCTFSVVYVQEEARTVSWCLQLQKLCERWN